MCPPLETWHSRYMGGVYIRHVLSVGIGVWFESQVEGFMASWSPRGRFALQESGF